MVPLLLLLLEPSRVSWLFAPRSLEMAGWCYSIVFFLFLPIQFPFPSSMTALSLGLGGGGGCCLPSLFPPLPGFRDFGGGGGMWFEGDLGCDVH